MGIMVYSARDFVRGETGLTDRGNVARLLGGKRSVHSRHYSLGTMANFSREKAGEIHCILPSETCKETCMT